MLHPKFVEKMKICILGSINSPPPRKSCRSYHSMYIRIYTFEPYGRQMTM